MDVIKTVEHTEMMLCGKLMPVTITRLEGLFEYQDADGSIHLADGASIMDFGPKLGVIRAYDKHPDVPFTEEEKAAGRAQICAVATQAMTEQGLW